MTSIKVTPLGAGQDVGRSCLLVEIGGKHIMLDCGMHMGFQDERRFPDFSYVTPGAVDPKTSGLAPGETETLTDHLDAVIISHFHLDHCGALPYMTEMVRKGKLLFQAYCVCITFSDRIQRPYLHDAPHQGHRAHPAGRHEKGQIGQLMDSLH